MDGAEVEGTTSAYHEYAPVSVQFLNRYCRGLTLIKTEIAQDALVCVFLPHDGSSISSLKNINRANPDALSAFLRAKTLLIVDRHLNKDPHPYPPYLSVPS
jgi:hypothetical protein